MKQLSNSMKTVIFGVQMIVPFLASPVLAFTMAGSEAIVQLKGRNGVVETCAIPLHFDESRNTQLEKDRGDEAKLCRMALSNDTVLTVQERTAGKLKLPTDAKEFAVCPKLNSTNPGSNFIKIPKGWTREQAETTLCEKESKLSAANQDLLDLEAKFKSSITCSYTPSALAGYHFSRLLGNVGRVPVVVLRTMDREHHMSIVEKAESILGSSKEDIARAWRQFEVADKAAGAGQENTKLYIDKGALLYGGLQKNLKGEEKYSEISGAGSYDTRYERFVVQPPFKRVADGRDVSQAIVGKSFAEALPTLNQMKDVSDMILFDVLLSQDDRIGNIHYKVEAREVSAAGGFAVARKMSEAEETALDAVLKAARSTKVTDAQLAQLSKQLFPDGRTILVRAMYLKDNDCGVDVDKRENKMRSVKALEQVRHMSGETYSRFLRLADDVLSDRFKTFATETLLYRSKDYEGGSKSLKENVKYALKTLKDRCRSGSLKLDLDVTYSSEGLAQPAQAVACE